MKILALDTSAEFASIAALDGDHLTEVLIHSRDGFGHHIFQQVESLLGKLGWRVDDIDCFGAAAGPGSFTGVRVALSAIKGLAEAAGKPMVAVSNLQALAAFGDAPLRAPLLDARRGEIYAGLYDASLQLVQPEVVARFQDWLPTVPGDAQFIVADPLPFESSLPREPLHAPRALASAVAHIARTRFLNGQAQDPAATDANYVRRADAELKWVDR
ncbi:MAG: tRNA (adenosine(37)-N6)-threonylcarbamoyltransferase complex dimerization subunit type 1 TsaB [Bryobacterales bacterium]|nr:tRNA (adenosine(37)-N6)-threonylcarbamoyltransferase complex dimerization subunit type 1 TsaB [Bryobacterales bacterium]